MYIISRMGKKNGWTRYTMFSLQRYFYLKRAVFLRSTKFGSETWGAVILQVYRMWSLPTGYVVSDVLSKTCHQSRVRSHKGC